MFVGVVVTFLALLKFGSNTLAPSDESLARLEFLRKEPILQGLPGWRLRFRSGETGGDLGNRTDDATAYAGYDPDLAYTEANVKRIINALARRYPSYGKPIATDAGFGLRGRPGVAVLVRIVPRGHRADVMIQVD